MHRTSTTTQTTTSHTDYLRVDGVSHSYAERRVLTDVGFSVEPGDRLGLIGENGVGKSTLLRIAAGAEVPDAGVVTGPRRIGLLWQEVRHRPSDTVADLIEDALAEVRAIERELEAAAAAVGGGWWSGERNAVARNEVAREEVARDAVARGAVAGDGVARTAVDRGTADRYAAALDAAERADVWSVDSRRDEVLAGLGVGGIPLTRRLDEISGGQRSRFALAALLLGRPEALLLDEPTNHLDDSAAAYLQGQLVRWRGPVVFASHDRQFLDDVATGLLDIDPSRGGPRRFGAGRSTGAYTAYLAEKAAERSRWEEQFAAEQDELRRLALAVETTARQVAPNRGPRDNDTMGYDFKSGTVQRQISRRVRNARGRLDELTANQVRRPSELLTFAGIPHGSHPLDDGTLLQLTDARIDGRLELQSFGIEPRARLLVTGRNGAGKSTLLAALAGLLPLDAGTLHRRRGLRVGMLEQDVRFVDPTVSPRRLYESAVGERRAESLSLASLGLIAPRDLDREVGLLSTGQQRRLALALIIAKPPHVFLLDEPTNHLSLALATELEEALGGYPGAIVVASHDRWLRRRWTGERLNLVGGRLST
jgi:macrolide transport system ATP-binding/permease protein